ncbi:C40 family peptidase [Nocardioides sp. DS6]|uniref:C40 family peptidase n=1 Tax=Nocardioides eburneus TaxID=3231482 RepID=A0ABV3STM2_9ACTN
MRSSVPAVLLAVSLLSGLTATDLAHAEDPGDHGTVPSKKDVDNARRAVADKATDVAGVRRAMAAAQARLETASIAAEQAAEAYNGARWRAERARAEARAARRVQRSATADLEKQRQAYAGSLVSGYSSGQGLSAVAGLVQPGGIDEVQRRSSTVASAQSALDAKFQRYQASKTLADVAEDQASAAEKKAVAAERTARSKREAARQAANAAAAQARSVAAERTRLLRQLAHLQHISVALATRRQDALEEQRQEKAEAAAAAAAQAAAQKAAHEAAQKSGQKSGQKSAQQSGQQAGQQHHTTAPDHDAGDAASSSGQAPAAPPADDAGAPAPTPPASAPAPSGGVGAAIAFARQQIGEPYVWGAAGPDSWDCSGLTMRAWEAGGIALPHYSVAQYEESTPISPADLRPGDLLFWGTSNSPSSIHHVALYVGDGQMIEAPRTGVPVREISMYAWEAPNFYARP